MPYRVYRERDLLEVFHRDCETGDKKCYWVALYDEYFNKYWWLFYKGCDCPCECEDPIRKNLEFPEPFFDTCPSLVYIPGANYGEFIDPETGKIQLKEVNYRETNCIFPVQDCFFVIRFEYQEEYVDDLGDQIVKRYYSITPNIIYNPYAICNDTGCTDNAPFRCLDRLELLYDFPGMVEEEDLPSILSYFQNGRLSCNHSFEYYSHCRFDSRRIYQYLDGLSNVIGKRMLFSPVDAGEKHYWYYWGHASGVTSAYAFGIKYNPAFGAYHGFGVSPAVDSFLKNWLGNIPDFDTHDAEDYAIGVFVRSIADIKLLPNPGRLSEVFSSSFFGLCLIYFLPEGVRYFYHTCKDGFVCPDLVTWFDSPECPYRVYDVGIFGCVPENPALPPPPTFCLLPFCSQAYNPPVIEKYQNFEVIENPEGGVRITGEIEEVHYGVYYDIFTHWREVDNTILIVDPYGNLHAGYTNLNWMCYFDVGFRNNGEGRLGYAYALSNCFKLNELKSLYDQVYERFVQRCGNTPDCEDSEYVTFPLEYGDLDKGIAPIYIFQGPYYLHYRFGLELLDGPNPKNSLYYYGLNPQLFDETLRKVCVFTYTQDGWNMEDSSCGDCTLYQTMLDALLDACWKDDGKYKRNWWWRSSSFKDHLSERVIFPANMRGCYCTVRDVLDFISNFKTIKVILTCYNGPFPAQEEEALEYFECGPYLVYYTVNLPLYPGGDVFDLPAEGSYIFYPCVEFSKKCPKHDIELDFRKRLGWVLVPYTYFPCYVFSLTTTTTTTTTPEPESEQEESGEEDQVVNPCAD